VYDYLTMDNPLAMLDRAGLISENARFRRTFGLYTKLVEMYVTRHLTVSTDIVNAFSGLLIVLEEHFAGGFVSALPIAALDLALLWTPGQKMLRRSHYTAASGTPDNPQPYFPSWSWAGWMPWVGWPAYYHLFASPPLQPFPESLVETFSLHHHGTLHTILARSSTSVLQPAIQTPGILGPDFGPEVL
jgi:hypothetical protein